MQCYQLKQTSRTWIFLKRKRKLGPGSKEMYTQFHEPSGTVRCFLSNNWFFSPILPRRISFWNTGIFWYGMRSKKRKEKKTSNISVGYHISKRLGCSSAFIFHLLITFLSSPPFKEIRTPHMVLPSPFSPPINLVRYIKLKDRDQITRGSFPSNWWQGDRGALGESGLLTPTLTF